MNCANNDRNRELFFGSWSIQFRSWHVGVYLNKKVEQLCRGNATMGSTKETFSWKHVLAKFLVDRFLQYLFIAVATVEGRYAEPV